MDGAFQMNSSAKLNATCGIIVNSSDAEAVRATSRGVYNRHLRFHYRRLPFERRIDYADTRHRHSSRRPIRWRT